MINFKDVWEMYRIKFVIDKKVSWENFWALKGISFEIQKGETLGIIGENGAGKSTILKLIAGMLKPDRGEINVQGKISGLLELGAGFQPELTGKENIYLIAGLYGLNQAEIEKRYDKIVDFASIGKFIHAPVKCYSQGMFVRLAFAIAIHVEPDILLIDDTLAVGDEYFQRKCIKKIFELKEDGRSIIVVSHDMNMLRRLCKRVIFLKEGRIIRDDMSDKVMPLYTQMIGTREGVGVLEKKPLTLVFNNGRLFLNWQDKLLTPGSGAHTTLNVGNKWYSSSQADWEVKKEGESRLVATGKLYQLMLTQIWKLELADNYEIKLDIEIELEESLEIHDGHINIMLINEYSQWFTNLDKGEFPCIDDKDKDWQSLLEGSIFRNCIGVETKEIAGNKIPSLAFEQSSSSHQNQAQILNTDYFTNCRVLQYKTMGLQGYSVDQLNRFVYFSGKISLNIPDINKYLKNLQDEFTLSCGKLKLIFNNGQCILSYNDATLTKTKHISASIYVNGRWYSSTFAHWNIKKQGKDKMIVTGTWFNLPLIQVWEVEITNDSSFLWKVKLQIEKEVIIPEQLLLFMISGEYTYWFSDYGSGQFPDKFLEVSLDMPQRCISDGIIGFKSQSESYPAVFFKFFKGLNSFARILNSDFSNKARELQIRRVESERNTKFLPGEHLFFGAEITLSEKNGQTRRYNSNVAFQDKKLKFIFDNGMGRIYWDDRELTKRFGLYTSLRSGGRWYDSVSSAIWKIEEKNTDAIKVVGKWLHLPMKQYWQIRIESDKLIEFEVKMMVDKTIKIERLQINLMLSERYLKWITNKKEGLFPLFRENIDGDWECIYSGKDYSEYIGVLKNIDGPDSLPSIKFSPQKINLDWHLNILNSDVYFRGRVLQYLNTKQPQVSPGEYLYFKGDVTVEV